MRAITIMLFALVLGMFNICFADLYKYKDEHGSWHFSDRPPQDKQATVTPEPPGKQHGPSVDKGKQLFDKYQPQKPIEKATLAVVSIKSTISQGSGFFASEKGHILTNRHVVKPSETPEWKELQDSVEKREKAYRKVKSKLERAGAELEHMERQLESYREAIKEESSSHRRQILQSDYRHTNARFSVRKREYRAIKKEFDAKYRAFRKARSEFNWKSSVAVVSKQFKVTLKDETELSARLIEVCKKHDLALLKIDGYKTPFLAIDKTSNIYQGLKVYAVGSPYGLRDAVTSGIITRIDDKYIITDAQILPGNSGGPLLDEEGFVLGVNTLKTATAIDGQGFGLAIPIDVARREFKKYLDVK